MSTNTNTNTTRRKQYAAGTQVAIERTKHQIEEELRRLGAHRRAIMNDDERHLATVVFETENRRYRLTLPLPDPDDDRFWSLPKSRSHDSQEERAERAWRQDCMERWRALGEVIKALRIAQETKIVRWEDVLSGYVVLPDGQTVNEWMGPQLDKTYRSGQMPPMLPGSAPSRFQIEAPKPADDE